MLGKIGLKTLQFLSCTNTEKNIFLWSCLRLFFFPKAEHVKCVHGRKPFWQLFMNPCELVKWERQPQLWVKWCLLERYVKIEVAVPVKVILTGKRVLADVIKLRWGRVSPNPPGGRCLYKTRPFGFQGLDPERKQKAMTGADQGGTAASRETPRMPPATGT